MCGLLVCGYLSVGRNDLTQALGVKESLWQWCPAARVSLLPGMDKQCMSGPGSQLGIPASTWNGPFWPEQTLPPRFPLKTPGELEVVWLVAAESCLTEHVCCSAWLLG